MVNFENIYEISAISFSQTLVCHCSLGNGWYTNHLDILIVPDKVIPDYSSVERDIRNLSGMTATVEEALNAVFMILANGLIPKDLVVTTRAEGAVHFPVTLTKHLYNKEE